MRIYVDEGGVFANGQQSTSYATVGSLIIPDSESNLVSKWYSGIRPRLLKDGVEVKGRSLTETDIAEVVHGLRYFNTIFDVTAFDRNSHLDTEVIADRDQKVELLLGAAEEARIIGNSHSEPWGSWRAALEAFVARVNATPDDPLLGAVRAWSVSLRGRDSARGVARAPLPPALVHGAKAALRLKILERDKFRCVLCGASPATVPGCRLELDHIQPFSRGGRTEEANLRTLCHACNAGRGAGLDEDRGVGAAG